MSGSFLPDLLEAPVLFNMAPLSDIDPQEIPDRIDEEKEENNRDDLPLPGP
jgi:hypothetical protein